MHIELTVTAKGQVTFRQAVLRHLQVGPGDKIDVSLLPDGRVEIKAAGGGRDINRLYGILHRPGRRPVSLEQMQAAIETGHED